MEERFLLEESRVKLLRHPDVLEGFGSLLPFELLLRRVSDLVRGQCSCVGCVVE